MSWSPSQTPTPLSSRWSRSGSHHDHGPSRGRGRSSSPNASSSPSRAHGGYENGPCSGTALCSDDRGRCHSRCRTQAHFRHLSNPWSYLSSVRRSSSVPRSWSVRQSSSCSHSRHRCHRGGDESRKPTLASPSPLVSRPQSRARLLTRQHPQPSGAAGSVF